MGSRGWRLSRGPGSCAPGLLRKLQASWLPRFEWIAMADRLAFRGLDGRDVAFMERLRNLAREALTWEHLSDQQRLVWAAALDLDVVPVQEIGPPLNRVFL